MKTSKMEILKGSALFVLKHLIPLNIFEIAYVWGMYSNEFTPALEASGSCLNMEFFPGPYWITPDKEAEFLKKTLLVEGLVDEVIEVVQGEKVKSLKINEKGLNYLNSLASNGLRFKGSEKLKKLKPEVIQYRTQA